MSVYNWNLKDLFNSDEDSISLLANTKKIASEFNTNYKDKLKEKNTDEIIGLIEEYEAISQNTAKVMTYSFLKFATDSSLGAFYAKVQKKCSDISEELVFFEIEFNTLDEDFCKGIKSDKYGYFIQKLLESKKYQKSIGEEKILIKKDLTSASAFSRLFDEFFSALKFEFEGKSLSEEEILSKLHSSDRETRKNATTILATTLSENANLLKYIFNMIKTDLSVECEIRGYESVELPRHLDNQISQKSVDALINTTNSNFDLSIRYYKSKASILGYDKLYDYDRYAPFSENEKVYDYETSKKIVLDAFKSFDEEIYTIAKKALDEGWCDVYPKDKKRGGAFSHPATTDTHPYVLLNHTDKKRDLFTLAHELGHAIHQYLSRSVGYLGSDTPLTTSESASVFAEMLVFDYLVQDISDKDELISLYGGKLEDIFATLFRQIIFTNFERKVHAHDGELEVKDFSKYWIDENQKMFGDALELSENYKIFWSYIPHFIHSPFYCYSYSYGQLLVLTLYRLYKDNHPNFVQNYKKFLSSGGSKSPKDLVVLFGLDIEDEKFWQKGIDEVGVMVGKFEKIINNE